MFNTIKPFALERYFAQYEFHVKHMLCGSDAESLTIAELLAMESQAKEQFLSLALGYTESQGAPALRQAIADIYEKISPQDVLVHSGAEEAILLFMQSALKPGDHIIVHYPCYQSLYEIARTIGADVSLWEASPQDWSLNVSALKQMLKPNTKVIAINTPHNPTGYLMPQGDFTELCRLCAERDIILFADEVYRESEYDPADRLPAACDIDERFVSLGVMSKTYGLPGLRIGWVATRNKTVFERMAELKDYTTICNAAPSEFLATLALNHRQTLVENTLHIVQNNLRFLREFFTRHAELLSWVEPKAGTIAFPMLRQGKIDIFSDRLVREAGILLLPASAYGYAGNHFRIGFGRRHSEAGLQALDAYLENGNKLIDAA